MVELLDDKVHTDVKHFLAVSKTAGPKIEMASATSLFVVHDHRVGDDGLRYHG